MKTIHWETGYITLIIIVKETRGLLIFLIILIFPLGSFAQYSKDKTIFISLRSSKNNPSWYQFYNFVLARKCSKLLERHYSACNLCISFSRTRFIIGDLVQTFPAQCWLIMEIMRNGQLPKSQLLGSFCVLVDYVYRAQCYKTFLSVIY